MVTKTEAIKNFLSHTIHKDLAALYNYSMEVQVNVAQDDGERIAGEYKGKQWFGYSDGVNTWKSFRIPYNAHTKPEYADKPLMFDLVKHAEGIGMTGWDWVDKVSRWVAFDFDAIAGHSEHHTKKLSDRELKDLQETIQEIEWCTIRKSTSGSGLHIYVFLETPEPTDTHTEHAALARAILGHLSALTGKDLSVKIDACGQNMWVWHRKMLGTDGLTLIKEGTKLKKVPTNWRDHIEVIRGVRAKTIPKFIKDENNSTLEETFLELSGQRSTIVLDDDHKRLIDYLSNRNDYYFAFDSDNNMLISHTYALKLAHNDLNLRGVYETLSEGKDSTQNCFAYPLRNGGWVVRRYSQGIEEHPTWDQDRKGWTRCYLNREPDLKTVAAQFGGTEHPQGGFVFTNAKDATKAAQALGSGVKIPDEFSHRPIKLKLNKDDRLCFEFDSLDQDPQIDMSGWIKERRKWKRVADVKTPPKHEVEVANYDDIVRHIVDQDGNDCGWVIKPETGWCNEPISHVSLFLSSFNLDPKDIKDIQGSSIARAWTIVNEPFKPEYPGNRKWNRFAPQLAYPPTEFSDNLKYPTWLKILQHCGEGLDQYIKDHSWCKANGISTGADYLKCWIASVFQNPSEPLPYLFLYSKEQNTGKSILHEALKLLVTRGVVRAEHALADTTFNGELEGAIICVIEEKNLNDKKNKAAYDKIKDWVTSRHISIRKLYETPYSVVNTTHWLQCSNDQNAVPVFPGDSRIVVLHVNPLKPDEEIPKRDLIRQLGKEAPDFLSALLNLELPDSKERLALPVIATAEKEDAERTNMSPLDVFIKDHCYFAPGSCMLFADFYDAFYTYLDDDQKAYWTKIRVGKELDRHRYPKGKTTTPNMMVGNISLTKYDAQSATSIYVLGPNNRILLKAFDPKTSGLL